MKPHQIHVARIFRTVSAALSPATSAWLRLNGTKAAVLTKARMLSYELFRAECWLLRPSRWLLVLCLGLSGCSRPLSENALVVTQTPCNAPVTSANSLDLRYPAGARVVVADGDGYKNIRVLSVGLAAAGEPVVSCDGKRIVFSGKASPDAKWQIYESGPSGSAPRALTAVPGGAADPALLSDGALLYVSPVTKKSGSAESSSLYVLRPGGPARQLTFGLAVSDPTVLSDGRILFVSTGADKSCRGSALYTINNDGTEISAYAGQHDPPTWLRRPRQLSDDRIVFLAGHDASGLVVNAEFVSSARPFQSRAKLFPRLNATIRSVQPSLSGRWLVCAQTAPLSGDSRSGFAMFEVDPSAATLESPTLNDPAWDTIEATPATASLRPMGRLSNVDLSHDTGQLLCLNVNDTTLAPADASRCAPAKRIRVFTNSSTGRERLLGEVEVQADGSFMAEVPADIPLGFEALDQQGTVLRRESPLMWVRPGENRACIGCHEPHNHSPRNVRPLAVRIPVPRLLGVQDKLAQKLP